MSFRQILNTLNQTRFGPICSNKEWNTKKLPLTIADKLKQYQLTGTFSSANPVNTDDSLADTFFKAGCELAVDLGLHCADTERIIKISEEDLADALDRAPREIRLGTGRDEVVMRPNRPESPQKPLLIGPLSVVVSEDIWVPLHQRIAEQREVDVFQGASVTKMNGVEILAGTPFETLAARYQAQLTREALWRAGRPGMPTTAVINSPTAFGQLGGFGINGGFSSDTDIAIVLAPGEMQTSYPTLHKVVHSINCNSKRYVSSAAMIGGYSGPVEGAALTQIAVCLLHFTIHQADCSGGSTTDVRYGGTTGAEGIWATSIANQAITRNTELLRICCVSQKGGPCTEMLLYECAATMMAVSVSGATGVITPRSAGGEYDDCLTPLECKFCGEVLKKSAGMSRQKVNQVAKELLPRYQQYLLNAPRGKGFRDCYDLETLEPTEEWLNIYTRTKNELHQLDFSI
jgi:methylamine--corrinoid protein Co-methyltransferase